MTDSIDGLGFQIQDLKPELQVVAVFRLVQRDAMTPEQRKEITDALSGAKTKLDRSQKRVRDAIEK